MSQGYPGPGRWSGGPGWPGPGGGIPPQQGGFNQLGGFHQPGGYAAPSGFGVPGGWQQPPPPAPKPLGGRGPLILGALAVVGLAMIGLILYSLLSGPDYQHDDYVVPAAGAQSPLPNVDPAELEAYVSANELYAQTVPEPVRCELPNPDFDVPSATDQEVITYIDELMGCNMRVWNPAFQATQRWELTRPKVNVYGESVTTPCGNGKQVGPNGMYCSANQEVYFSRDVSRWQRPHLIDDVMAHEFGHNIQARSAIFVASFLLEQSTDKVTAKEVSRRVELQADCLEGLFLRSIYQSRGYTDQQLADIRQSVFNDGDDAGQRRAGRPVEPADHGTSDSRVYWWSLGFSGSDIGRCNTFVAPSDYVR